MNNDAIHIIIIIIKKNQILPLKEPIKEDLLTLSHLNYGLFTPLLTEKNCKNISVH